VAIVYQLNKRDLPNVASVEEMTQYLGASPDSVVEASAKSGVGVTATLRTAVSKILDNLKNNVDTTLYEEPALSAPDMSQKSGVAHHSAGTPKLSMRGESPAPTAAPAAPRPAPAPAPLPVLEEAADEDPFDTTLVHVQTEEEGPFGVADAHSVDFEDPFDATVAIGSSIAAKAPATPAQTAPDLQDLLANAGALVASLEAALERARENERKLRAWLGQ